jgi:hypothetical protein
MAKTVVGLMDDRDEAESVVRKLVDEGFARSDISIMASNAGGSYSTSETARSSATSYSSSDSGTYGENRHSDSRDVGSGALTGAGTGAVLGGIAGLVVGMAGLAIPGIGPVIAAGPLAAALAGAGAGAVAGGLIGALVNIGVPEDEANYYAEGMRRGGVLVTVNARDEDKADHAADIMRDHGAVDIEERASQWKQTGWSRFDETAAPYAGDTSIRSRGSIFADNDIGSGRRSGSGSASAYGSANDIQGQDTQRSAYTGMERRRNSGVSYHGVERRAA